MQPLSRGFHEAVGEDVKTVLEQTLMKHCTLTEGDVVYVEHAGTPYALRVGPPLRSFEQVFPFGGCVTHQR